ncbi:MAG TPA: translocation/assembly module TamB domain-containing protein [Candidatus Aminicenantes bacterium]|nr:translocation/assembly module TamB domain-containing protein [Candidatus Aminicenantes bacterium]HPS99497.1 translocation/assembly module TamB domain-containing protein [Candidatus Aminicenantes bacterium]
MVALIGWQKFFTQFLVRRYLHSVGSVSYQYFPFKVTLLDPSQGSDTVSFSAFSAEAGLESFDLFTLKTTLSVNLQRPVIALDFSKETPGSEAGALSFPGVDFKGTLADATISLKTRGIGCRLAGVDGTAVKRGKSIFLRLVVKDMTISLDETTFHGFGKLDLILLEDRVLFRNLNLFAENLNLRGGGKVLFAKRLRYNFLLEPAGNLTQVQKILELPFLFEGEGKGELKLFNDAQDRDYILVTVTGKNGKIASLPISQLLVRYRQVEDDFSLDLHPDDLSVHGEGTWQDYRFSLRRFPSEKFLLLFDTELPFSSLCDADFRVIESQNILQGKALCQAPQGATRNLPLSGLLEFRYNLENLKLSLSAPALRSGQDLFSLSTVMDFQKERYDSLSLSGSFSRLPPYLPALLFFTESDFSEWKPDGKGSLEVTLDGPFLTPHTQAKVRVDGLSLMGVPVGEASATTETRNSVTRGSFSFRGEKFQGSGDFSSDKTTVINLSCEKFDLRGIDKIFELKLPLMGGSGRGEFRSEVFGPKNAQVTGTVEGELFTFGGQRVRNYQASLESLNRKGDGFFRLSSFHGLTHHGDLSGSFTLTFSQRLFRTFDVDVRGTGLDFASLSPSLAGRFDMALKGIGDFGKDKLFYTLSSPDFAYYKNRPLPLDSRGFVVPSEDSLTLSAEASTKKRDLKATLKGTLNLVEERADLEVKLDSSNINALLPWDFNEGEFLLSVSVKGPWKDLQYRGIVQSQGKTLSLPNYSQTIENFRFVCLLNNNQLNISALSGTLGGGAVTGGGMVTFSKGELKDLLITLKGKDIVLIPMEKVKAKADADLKFSLKGSKILVSGAIVIDEMEYQKEIEEAVRFGGTEEVPSGQSEWMRRLEFDLHFSSRGKVWVRNSLLKGEAFFDINLRGDPIGPVMLGSLKFKSGELSFSDRTFNLLRGEITFDNPYYINPRLNFISECFIKEYRIRLSVSGYKSQPVPGFTSSPSLPPQEILTLLAMGENYKRTYSNELSSVYGTSTLVASTVTDFLQRKTLGKFKIDTVRVDPFVSGSTSEPTPRISLGKKVYKNLFVIYSFDLTNQQRSSMLFAEYSLTKNVSLIAFRDENGFFNFDIRIRRESR